MKLELQLVVSHSKSKTVNHKYREWKILRFKPFLPTTARLMPPNQPPTETSAWEGGCLQGEGSSTEGTGEQAWTLHWEG